MTHAIVKWLRYKYRRQADSATGLDAAGIGFDRAVSEGDYRIHACAILHDHAHLVIGSHLRFYERIIAHLKARATQELNAEGIHPFSDVARADKPLPSPWAEGLWKVYCFDPDHVRNAIAYVENNPKREGPRPQRWRFVTPGAP